MTITPTSMAISVWGPVHTRPDEFHFENASNIFRPHYAGGIYIFDLSVFEENSARKITWSSWRHRFQTVFCPHENEKPEISHSSDLKSVFGKLRFGDGLVWTESLTSEIMLRFQISPA